MLRKHQKKWLPISLVRCLRLHRLCLEVLDTWLLLRLAVNHVYANMYVVSDGNAVVSTSPTPDGNVAIDSFHQFEDAQWLLIQKAEEEKLLKVTFNLPEPILDKLIGNS
ncbi:unnamed protein product [Fraxinus pennsylvanica]|uniref:Uncharacterized protein n=1 Tax=Fraxinus pennsylvanica TaxID=56036 RepID=A0AAD2DVP2_9LAMI|nr:unnamed protein product [Fraxinus pennsylvanica]